MHNDSNPDDIEMSRETIIISNGRKLYAYTFRSIDSADDGDATIGVDQATLPGREETTES